MISPGMLAWHWRLGPVTVERTWPDSDTALVSYLVEHNGLIIPPLWYTAVTLSRLTLRQAVPGVYREAA